MTAKRNGPGAGARTVHKASGDQTSSSFLMVRDRCDIRAYAEHFAKRVLQDAFASTRATQLRRRADEFEAARHRPGVDCPGHASEDVLRARWHRLTEQAKALRATAEVALLQDDAITADELSTAVDSYETVQRVGQLEMLS